MEDRHIDPLDARLGRARLRGLQGDHTGARQFYKDVLQADPGSVPARLGMASEAHALGLDAHRPGAGRQPGPRFIPATPAVRALQKRIPRRPRAGVSRSSRWCGPTTAATGSGPSKPRAPSWADPQTEIRIAR